MDYAEIIKTALNISKTLGFSGNFVALGGGEVNNTFKLDFDDHKIIMRISKDEGLYTLKAEASSLELLKSPYIPSLIYFDKDQTINNHMWILESFIPGVNTGRLTTQQFTSLGKLLAVVHMNLSTEHKISLRGQFIDVCKLFGDEQFLLNHPDERLRNLIVNMLEEFDKSQFTYDQITPCLIHSDATPSNILIDGDDVGLIDWEFSKYSDPMCDFSTIYYEDIEYNKGKWRIKISEEEKSSLFKGYESAGGKINEERIRFWIKFDKLGALVFLYWRINQSTRTTDLNEVEQYKLDYDNLINSLLV
jgi:Ser/Thr protein kinase RdoA (MazF antagonist)